MRAIQEQYVVDGKGQKTAVIIPIDEYEELLEDLHDLLIIVERRDEPTITFEDIKKGLKEDGIL
ncbi:MAG: hypothetical protein GIS02_04310 [Methanosarcinales archaeon]|uniref:Uncharacterized protein n=1 Tax=Candidatus Ethanoperedens thermophilum TaxID=2766897 RepID=A0A848DB20_9EURY|nr:hypothetical protein [Candidatus Ethanoperedens thermophilum]